MTTKSLKWAVVTGASGGIGQALAEQCAQDGYAVLLAGRDEKKLRQAARHIEQTHHVKTLTYTLDLGKAASPRQLHAFAQQRRCTVAVLINNAGFGDYGPFEQSKPEVAESMIGVNISALTAITRLFAADMLKRQQGRIMNVASTAAFLPGPYMAVYYATKAYVLSFSQALAEEWRGSGVTMTTLCPGPTSTGFATNAHAQNATIFRGKLPTAATVAAYGYKAMRRGKPIAVHGFRNKLTVHTTRLLPRSLQRRLVARAQRP